MQTYTQTFAGAQTWTLNVPGAYFVTLQCSNAINVRLYKGGKKLDLGDMTGLLAGLEIGPLIEPGQVGYQFAFDRVEIDVTGADTIKVGIGNGAARYARLNGSMDLLTIQPAAAAIIQRPELATGSYATSAALAVATAEQVFSAGANTNGAIILSADGWGYEGTNIATAFIHKATAPASITDGQMIAGSHTTYNNATTLAWGIRLPKEQYIPAGQGLYFITIGFGLTANQNFRACRYKLL